MRAIVRNSRNEARNNLLSTVDISWQNSLHEETSPRHYL